MTKAVCQYSMALIQSPRKLIGGLPMTSMHVESSIIFLSQLILTNTLERTHVLFEVISSWSLAWKETGGYFGGSLAKWHIPKILIVSTKWLHRGLLVEMCLFISSPNSIQRSNNNVNP